MHLDLVAANEYVYLPYNLKVSNYLTEPESKEYGAATFLLNELNVKFRVAKITPTKIGQFVTLWKRNENGITQPHDVLDEIDKVIVSVRKENYLGQFVFPKSELVKQGIFSTPEKEGKRGFRVYPPWDLALNKQAQKTQNWQLKFFLEIKPTSVLNKESINRLYTK